MSVSSVEEIAPAIQPTKVELDTMETVPAEMQATSAETAPNEPVTPAPVEVHQESSLEATQRIAASPVTKDRAQNVLPAQVVRDANAHRSTSPTKRKKRAAHPGVWLGTGLGTLMIVAGGAAAGAYSSFAASGTIAPNVFIAGVPVGGLTPQAARTRVLSHFGKPKIALLCDGEKVQMPIEKLGAKLSIEPTLKKAFGVGRDGFLPNNLLRVYGSGGTDKNFMLPIEWDKKKLVNGLNAANSKIAIAPIDARLQGGEFGLEVVPDRAGRALNTGAAAHLLQRRFYVGMPSMHVPVRQVAPKVTAHDLEGRDVQLAQYTTRFNPGLAGRSENLRIACRAIQNKVLMPGETFSFNASTGERTASKGYRMAHIFLRQPGAEESEVVDGLAGGVCQVSSTLFNAVRKTNAKADANPLKIVERTSHSLPVTYVPRGLDATVAWPYKDFKFRNVTNHPVYVRTQIGASRLNISIWGRIPNA